MKETGYKSTQDMTPLIGKSKTGKKRSMPFEVRLAIPLPLEGFSNQKRARGGLWGSVMFCSLSRMLGTWVCSLGENSVHFLLMIYLCHMLMTLFHMCVIVNKHLH